MNAFTRLIEFAKQPTVALALWVSICGFPDQKLRQAYQG